MRKISLGHGGFVGMTKTEYLPSESISLKCLAIWKGSNFAKVQDYQVVLSNHIYPMLLQLYRDRPSMLKRGNVTKKFSPFALNGWFVTLLGEW